jgi:hypothetical protein
MEYRYENASGLNYSEANATTAALGFDPDWLGMGAKSLSLWFRGTAGNDATEPMYVELTDSDGNGAAVVYDGDADDVKEESWHEWVMPMTEFTADVNADHTYDANVTNSNSPTGVTGSTNGYGSSWYYYPYSQWWNIWLDNGRYDWHRKKDIWILLFVKKRNAGESAYAEFLTGGATVDWMADPNGSIRPPLPGDAHTLELEERYIDRTADPCVIVPTTSYQAVYIHIVLPWNPRWVFLDIRGYNYDIIGGIIIHRCRSKLNLRKVEDLTIGFGYGVPPEGTGTGTVYFDDISLCASKCALSKRLADFALVDFAPGGAPSGDCAIDYKEIQAMSNTWLAKDSFVETHNPTDVNLVVYYPLNEGDGNKVYSGLPDPCNAKWTGNFYQRWGTPGDKGISWATPGSPIIGGSSCVYVDGTAGARISCRSADLGIGALPGDINQITISIWAKWLGPRYFDPYLLTKGQGFCGKRGGWSDSTVIWTFWISADDPGAIGLGHYSDTVRPDVVSPQGTMDPFIGQWVHVAATYDGDRARLYLNGGEVDNGLWRFSHGNDSTIDLTIGCTQDVNAQTDVPTSFYGYLDELRIYNHALEANEVAYLADTTPEDPLWIPVPSAAEIYEEEIPGQRIVNFKDFALIAKKWLEGFSWP